MDEKTKSENTYSWINWIDEIENMIQQLYYIEQFDMAKKAENKLLKVKEQLKDDKLTSNLGKKWSIAYQLVDIQYPIKYFLDNEGYIEIKKAKVDDFLEKSNKVIYNLKEKTSKQAFEELRLVMQEYNQNEFNEMERREISEEISKIVLKILEMQVKNGEEINIEAIEEFCTQENLIKTIIISLINKAQVQNEEDRKGTLEIARKLTTEDLKNPNIWRELAQVKDIKIANSNENKETENEEKFLPSVQETKEKRLPFQALRDLFSKISEGEIGLYFYDTKFVLGEIDKETGEYKNFKVKYCNLKDIDKLPIETKKQVLEMKTRAKIIDKRFEGWFENLKKVELLDEVSAIIERAFFGCRSLKELKIGKGLKDIPEKCFMYNGLEKLEIPSNIQNIGESAFSACPIEEIVFEEGLKEIGEYAFFVTRLEKIEIPKSTRKIGEGAFDGICLEQIQILGDGVLEIGNFAFGYDPIVKIVDNKDVIPTRTKKSEFAKQYKVEQTPTVYTEISYRSNEATQIPKVCIGTQAGQSR